MEWLYGEFDISKKPPCSGLRYPTCTHGVHRSFALSLHVFMVLFKRHMALNALMSWVLLGAGWFLVAFVVAIGPLAIETSGRGSYFGPSGFWYT